MFLSVFFFGYFALNVYLLWRLRSLWFPRTAAIWCVLAAFLLTAAYPAARIFAPDEDWPVFEKLACIWMGVAVFAFFWFAVGECLWRLLKRKGCGRRARQTVFITAMALTGITALWGWMRANQLNIVHYAVQVNKQAGSLEKLRVVLLSDLHLGKGKPAQWLQRVVEQTNAQSPDLVVLAGDIVDSSAKSFEAGGYAAIFRQLKAPLGVFAVRGNHDFFDADRTRLALALKQAGILLLDDKTFSVQNAFYLAGRKDYGQKDRLPLDVIVKDLPKDKPLLLLDHRPNRWEDSAQAGVDVQFSGHTHGGQFFPATLVTALLYTIDHGMMKKGPFALIVSSGAGLWGPPFRVGSQSEIVVVDIAFQAPGLRN